MHKPADAFWSPPPLWGRVRVGGKEEAAGATTPHPPPPPPRGGGPGAWGGRRAAGPEMGAGRAARVRVPPARLRPIRPTEIGPVEPGGWPMAEPVAVTPEAPIHPPVPARAVVRAADVPPQRGPG